MEIIFDEELKESGGLPEETADLMTRAAEICVSGEGLDPALCEVSFTFAGPDEMKSLNAAYRQKDAVTDVLSFPQYDDFDYLENEEEICLGDVVICEDVARRQAEEYGHSYERELVYLFVHSVLHLLGYDHMEDEEKAKMRAREEEVMKRIGLSRASAGA